MVASRQVEIPLVDNLEGNSVHLHKLLGESQIHFCLNLFFQAAKRVGADLLAFAAPESAQIVSGRKNFKTVAKSVGKQTLRKQIGSGGRKRTASSVLPTKSAKTIGPEEMIS